MFRVEHEWVERGLACVCDGEAVTLAALELHMDQSFEGDAIHAVYGTALVDVDTLRWMAERSLFGMSPGDDLSGFNPVISVRIGLSLPDAVLAELAPGYAGADSPRALFDVEVDGARPARDLRRWVASGIDQGIVDVVLEG